MRILILILIDPFADTVWVIGIQVSNPNAKKIRTFFSKTGRSYTFMTCNQ